MELNPFGLLARDEKPQGTHVLAECQHVWCAEIIDGETSFVEEDEQDGYEHVESCCTEITGGVGGTNTGGEHSGRRLQGWVA